MANSKSEEEKMREEPGMSCYVQVPKDDQKTNGPYQKAQVPVQRGPCQAQLGQFKH